MSLGACKHHENVMVSGRQEQDNTAGMMQSNARAYGKLNFVPLSENGCPLFVGMKNVNDVCVQEDSTKAIAIYQ